MQKKIFQFSSKRVSYYFDADFSYLQKIADKSHAVVITDENIFKRNSQGDRSEFLTEW